MRYRIKYYPDGHEYHAYKTNPPAHTEGWEDVAALPRAIIDAEKEAFRKLSVREQIKEKLIDNLLDGTWEQAQADVKAIDDASKVEK